MNIDLSTILSIISASLNIGSLIKDMKATSGRKIKEVLEEIKDVELGKEEKVKLMKKIIESQVCQKVTLTKLGPITSGAKVVRGHTTQ